MAEPQRREHVQIGRTLRLDRRAALDLLRDLARERAVLADLRRLWAREMGAATLCFASDEQVLVQLAERVASGSLVIARVRPQIPRSPPPKAGAVDGAAAAQASDAAEQLIEEKSWLEITVVNMSTGQPVKDVPLLVTPQDGSEAEHKTNDKGLVRLDNIPKGPCVVRCKLGDVTRADALIFMGASSGAPPPPAAGAGSGKKTQKKGGPPCIVAVERHKVKTGETLDGLAKSVGSTWKKVAKFNWGADDPKKINGFLRTEVGSTKKTKDGKNYVFDDSDDPGIVLLPREWKADSMDTGQSYTIEVVPAAEAKTWIFSL